MSPAQVRKRLFDLYLQVKKSQKQPALSRGWFDSAMAIKTRPLMAEDGTIDGGDLRKAFLSVCLSSEVSFAQPEGGIS